MAGSTPTKPQPSGMMAIEPATVWTRTFSTGEKGKDRWRDRVLKMPKPMSEAGMVIMLTQPVWRPKYMLEKQMTRPTRRPAATARRVKLRPWTSSPGLATVGVCCDGRAPPCTPPSVMLRRP